MKRLFLGLASVAALIALGGSAGAITNGQPDGNRHPYVGLAVFDVAGPNGPVPSHRCSASLLTPTVVLTAGHCTDGTARARIWFDENVQTNTEYPFSGPTSYDGMAFTNPGFCIGCGNGLPGFAIRDVGIIVLSEPVPTNVVSIYAQLPAPGIVDGLANKTAVDVVGYGVNRRFTGGGPPVWGGPRVRLLAPTQLVSGNFVHSAEFVRLTQNPGGGSGGTCFGDSGGPSLLGGTRRVLAVTSYGTNGNCAGVGYGSRIDIPAVLAWIRSFL